jgi:hypothetical protein
LLVTCERARLVAREAVQPPRGKAREELRGFVTTRFVEANSSDDATREALRLVRGQLTPMLRNPPSDLPRLTVRDAWQGDSQYSDTGPGTGFTFY